MREIGPSNDLVLNPPAGSDTISDPVALFSGIDLTNTRAVLAHALARLHPRVALAISFSLEDVLLLALAAEIEPAVRAFALDTGRLPEETLACAAAVEDHLGVRVRFFAPEAEQVEALVAAQGLYGFRESLEARHACCGVRKVAPLGRALGDLSAWITGQRRAQSVTRAALAVVEPAAAGPFKINPLAHWSLAEVEAESRRRGLPRHALYDRGYLSIGCAPCTRAVAPGEDERAGRWWWEAATHKECGLHGRPGFAHLADGPPR